MNKYEWLPHFEKAGWLVFHKVGGRVSDFTICIRDDISQPDEKWRVEVYESASSYVLHEEFVLDKSMDIEDVKAYAVTRWRINQDVEH